MSVQGPGERQDVVATKAAVHKTPACELHMPGIALKSAQPVPMVPTAANAIAAQAIAIGEEFVIALSGIWPIPSALLPAGAAAGDPLWITEADNSLASAADAAAVVPSLVTGVVAANNAIRWTKADANDDRTPRVQLVNPGANDQALAIDVDGRDVIVSLATGVAGAITSTAALVIAAINEHNDASQLVVAANEGASSGAGVVAAVALTALAGGAAFSAGLLKFALLVSIDETLDLAMVNLNLRDTF